MKKAIFNGSFDPFTLGHIDIVERALNVFDEIEIVIMDNIYKKGFIPILDRKKLIEEIYKNESKVNVSIYNGLTADLCKKMNIYNIIRGVRNSVDFEFEKNLDMANKQLDTRIETFFVVTKQNLEHISSTVVREIYTFDGDIDDFVSREVSNYLNDKRKNKE